jgi:hypothetical protein
MGTSDDKFARIKALEIKMAALLEERQAIQKKCDSEPDPKQRALYWKRLAQIDNTLRNFRSEIFSPKIH